MNAEYANEMSDIEETNAKLVTIIDSLTLTVSLQKVEINGLKMRLEAKSAMIEALDARIAAFKDDAGVVDVAPAAKPKRKYTRRKNATKRGPGRPRKNPL